MYVKTYLAYKKQPIPNLRIHGMDTNIVLVFISILFVLRIFLKRFRTDYINRIRRTILIVICKAYIFLKIDFT